jgi:hypothetical protein
LEAEVKINLPKRTIVLLITIAVVVIGAAVLYWFIERPSASTTTTADWPATHCSTGNGYTYISGDENWVKLETTYQPLGKSPAANVLAYKDKPIEIRFSLSKDRNADAAAYITQYHAAFQSVNLTKTVLPELYQVELQIPSGEKTLRNVGTLTYNPNSPESEQIAQAYGIKLSDVVSYTFYRVAPDSSKKEMVLSCNQNTTSTVPLIKKSSTRTESPKVYGITSHHQLFGDSQLSSLGTNSMMVRYVEDDPNSVGNSIILLRELSLTRFTGRDGVPNEDHSVIKIGKELGGIPDSNKYFAKVTYGDNKTIEKEFVDSSVVTVPVQIKDIISVEIFSQPAGTITKKQILKVSRYAFSGESDQLTRIGHDNFLNSSDYDSLPEIKKVLDEFSNNAMAGSQYKKHRLFLQFDQDFLPLSTANPTLNEELNGKPFQYQFNLASNGDKTQLSMFKAASLKVKTHYANATVSDAKMTVIAYNINNQPIERDLGKLIFSKSNVSNNYISTYEGSAQFLPLYIDLPVKITDLNKIEVYRTLISDPSVKELVFSSQRTPATTVSYPTPVANSALTCGRSNIKIAQTEMTADEKKSMYGNQSAYVIQTVTGKTWRLLLSAWKVKDKTNVIALKTMLGNLDSTAMNEKNVRIVTDLTPGSSRVIFSAGNVTLKQYEYYTGKKEVTVSSPTSAQLVITTGNSNDQVFCLSNAVKVDDLIKR